MFGLGPNLSSTLKYAYFLRFPILLGALPLWALAYLGLSGPTTFRNIMLADHPFGFISIGSQTAFLSIAVYLASRIVLRNAEARFGVEPLKPGLGWIGNRALVPFFMLFLGGPLLGVVAYSNHVNQEFVRGESMGGLTCLGWMMLGFFLTGLMIRGAKELAEDLALQIRPVSALGRGFAQFLGDGYYEVSRDRFREGHLFMMMFSLVAALTYMYGRIVLNPATTWDFGAEKIPSLSYVLALPTLLTIILSGLSFFLDRFRVPVFLTVFLVGFVNFQYSGNDHIFNVYPAKEVGYFNPSIRKDAEASPVVTPVVAHRAALQRLAVVNPLTFRNEKTAIVVCASGGGIQAAGWTARVLSGLDEVTEGEFSSRVFLFTGASGGSVGGYFFLESFDRESGNADPLRMRRIFPAATTSSLEAALWGMVQPDFTRFFLSSTIQDQSFDRGWALEESWRKQANFVWQGEAIRDAEDLNGRKRQFGEWVAGARDGVLPAVVFNSIMVETGELMALSSVDFTDISEESGMKDILMERGIDLDELRANITDPDYRAAFYKRVREEGIFRDLNPQELRDRGILPSAVRNQTFHRVFADPRPEVNARMAPDLSKRTAARLSATFPYITPIARPQAHPDFGDYQLPSYHIADGGFYDNLGIVPAVEWIRSVIFPDGLSGRIDKVIVLQITAEPEVELLDEKEEAMAPKKDDATGFRFVFTGPLEAIIQVRGATQLKRSDMELGLLQQLDATSDVDIQVVRVRPPSRVYPVGKRPPLSWNLSPENIEALRGAWLELTQDENSELVGFLNETFPGWGEAENDLIKDQDFRQYDLDYQMDKKIKPVLEPPAF